jgi:hypothetical protein
VTADPGPFAVTLYTAPPPLHVSVFEFDAASATVHALGGDPKSTDAIPVAVTL